MKIKIETAINNIKKLYENKNLAYHNFIRVEDMLDLAEKHNCNLTLGQTLAVLYRDCAYTPGSKDYVEQSINYV